MQTIVLILVLAITVEALIQYSKTIIEMLEKKQYKTFATQLTAILLSVFICFAAGVDLYTLVGVSFTVPWLGIVLEDVIGAEDAGGKAEVLTSGVPPNA